MKSSDTGDEFLAVHFQKAIAWRIYIFSGTSKRSRMLMSEPLQKNWAMKFAMHCQGCIHLLDVIQQEHLLVKGRSGHLLSSNLTKKCAQLLNILGTCLRHLLKRSLLVKSLSAYFMEVKVMVMLISSITVYSVLRICRHNNFLQQGIHCKNTFYDQITKQLSGNVHF